MRGDTVFRALRRGLLILFLLPPVASSLASSGEIRSVAVSPDGKLIAVVFGKDNTSFIYKVSLDTGIATRLTDAKTGKESSPEFSADGKLIAYSYVPEGKHQRIIVINVDGSNPHPLSESLTANLYATFSPDGDRIYFARSQPPPLDHAWDIFSVDMDGNNVQRLTHGMFYRVSQPSISPDGKSMAVMTVGADAHRQIAVYSLERPEQPIRSLQPHVPNEASHDPIIDYPNYMPDGKSILVMAASDRKGWRGELDYDIYRVDLTTGALERLTDGNGFASHLKVYADGKTALFLKWHKNWLGNPVSNELYLLDLQSHRLTPLKVNGLN
jgi:TolB protein